DPDDDGGRDARGHTARLRSRHGLGAAPAARLRHGWRPRVEPALDALHHAGRLSLSPPRAGLAHGAARRVRNASPSGCAWSRRSEGKASTHTPRTAAAEQQPSHRLLRSFPRKRESRATCSRLVIWVPAFAGTNGCCTDSTQPGRALKRDRRAHEIALAELDPALAQDVVGGGAVEIEVRQRGGE